MKKLTIILLSLLCLVGCSSSKEISKASSDAKSNLPTDFFDNYEEAKFDKFNSPASENGLADTSVWIEGKITDYFSFFGTEEASEFEYYCGTLIDKDNNKWFLLFDENVMMDNETKNSMLNNYQNLQNHNAIVCGVYAGYSGKHCAPSVYSTKIYDEDCKKLIKTGWGKFNEVSLEYDEDYLLKVAEQKVDEGLIQSVNEEQSTPEPTQTPEPVYSPSMEEKNAMSSAKDYLAYTAFSYNGLIDQLEFEGYSTEASTYAADNCGADWNEQAAKSAQSYLDFSSFSRQGLIDQLIFDGFTQEQAEYGVTAVGY